MQDRVTLGAEVFLEEHLGELKSKTVGFITNHTCLLYTSDAADDLLCVDLGGRRILKKKQI